MTAPDHSSLPALHPIHSEQSAHPDSPLLSPAHDPAARLSRSRHLNLLLHSQLKQANIALTARRNLNNAHQPSHSPEGSDPRQLSLDQLELQLEHARGRTEISHAAVKALDHSLLVSSHLLEPSPSLRDRHASLQALLTERDSLSLALLSLRNEVASLSSERLKLRKRLLALNRHNAALTSSLGALNRPASDLIEQLPAPVQAHYSRLQDDLLTTSTLVSIVSNVLQRLVAESGVRFFDPVSSLPLPASAAAAFSASDSDARDELLRSDEEEEAHGEEEKEEDEGRGGRRGWRRLLGLMLEAGEEAAALGGDGDGERGGRRWEDGQELPRNLREVMEAWRSERRCRIEGEEEGGE
ncbi:hypothetical protein JCM1840_005309 [Sporobolomyces johnsonii]